MVWFLVVVQAGVVLSAYGVRVDVAMLVSVAAGVLLVVIGGLLGKVRPN